MNDPQAQTPNPAATGTLAPKWWQDFYELPPVGTSGDEDVAFFIDVRTRLAIESRTERDKWVPMRDASLCLFNYGEWPQPPDAKFIENFLQNDVIGVHSIMFSEPVAIEVGVEDDGGEILAHFWNGPPVINHQSQDPNNTDAPPTVVPIPVAELGVPAPVKDPITGVMVAQPIDEQLAETLAGMGPEFEKYVVGIDNKALSDVYQLSHDRYWRKCMADEWVDQFVRTVLKGGWNTGHYQWDNELGHILENVPVVNVFPDPTRQFVWDWNHCQIHKVMRLQDAQRKFPQYAKLLYERSQRGQPVRVDGQSEMGYQYDRDFQSRMVTLAILWIADEPKPMTLEEALEGGHVEHDTIDEYDQTPLPPELNLPNAQNGAGNGAGQEPQNGEADAGTVSSGSELSGGGDRPVQPGDATPTETGDQAQGATAGDQTQPDQVPSPLNAPPTPPIKTRSAIFLPGSDTEVDLQHPQWPMRPVLRQIVMLDEILLEDEESPYPKINVIHSTAIAMEDVPFGQSLPWKMRHAQKADSIMANSIANNTRAFGNPAQWAALKIKARLKQELSSAYIEPNIIVGLESDEIVNGKPNAGFFEIPEMNEHHIKGREQMQNDRKELGGYTDAARGVPVTADPSGELQKVTMSAASGIVGAISKHIQGSIKHLASLMLHSLTHYASPKQIAECCRRYRPEVIAAIHLTLAPNACWKVDALLASGAGAQRQQHLDRLQKLNQTVDEASGMPIVDGETLQEAMNLDPSTIMERNVRAMKQKLALLAPPPQAAPAPPPEKPSESIAYKDVPPSAQSQMLAQAGITVSPAELQQHQVNQAAQAAAVKSANTPQQKPASSPSGGGGAQAA